jgi:acylphosphatase
MGNESDKRWHITVSGRVQGVGFRYFTAGVAAEFDLTGWVRNAADGTVLVEAQGREKHLSRFCRRLRRGPSLARVDDVTHVDAPLVEGETSLRISY